MDSTRLSHDVIRRLCTPEDRPDFVTCPVPGCGGHLHLFGKDDFNCKGGRSNPGGCDPKTVAKRLYELLGNGDEPRQQRKPKPSEQPDWQGFSLDDYCMIKRLDPPPD